MKRAWIHSALSRSGRIFSHVARFFLTSYINHWIAAPAGVVAAIVSTLGAGTGMILISASYETLLSPHSVIALNAFVGPLLAYALYLTTYYSLMLVVEKRKAKKRNDEWQRANLEEWFATVKYDYFAHLPSDIYLITLAGLMQAALQAEGLSVFYALVISQFVDDFITFLKEPVIWSGAMKIARWERESQTTLLGEAQRLIKNQKPPGSF